MLGLRWLGPMLYALGVDDDVGLMQAGNCVTLQDEDEEVLAVVKTTMLQIPDKAGTSSAGGRQGSTGAHASDVLAFHHIPAKNDVLPTKKDLVTDLELVDGRGGREMLTSAKPMVVFQNNNMLNSANLDIGGWRNNVRSWGVKGDDACHPHDSLDYACELLLKRDFGNLKTETATSLSTCKRVVVGGSHDLVQVAGWMEHPTGNHLQPVTKGATYWIHKLGYKPHDIRSRLHDNHLESLLHAGLTELSCYKWTPPDNEPASQGLSNTSVKTVYEEEAEADNKED
eukprot:g16617.t1